MNRVFRLIAVLVAVTAASFVAATSSRAESGEPTSELSDTSHQVSDIQKKIDDLRFRGRSARTGKLAAAANCGFSDSQPVFLPWGDTANYALAPGGDFSETSGWTFKNAAVAAEDNDPLGTNSLQLTKSDSEAISPVMCVNLEHPTIRLFVKDTGGNSKANVKVDVLYEDLDGHVKHLTLARLRARSEWSPSIQIPIAVNILATASVSGITAIAFDFKVEGLRKNEILSIADLYVDPYKSA